MTAHFMFYPSNGNMETINFSADGDTVFNRISKFSRHRVKTIMNLNPYIMMICISGLIMICKDCQNDKKSTYQHGCSILQSISYTPSQFSINAKTVAQKTGEEKIKTETFGSGYQPGYYRMFGYLLHLINY